MHESTIIREKKGSRSDPAPHLDRYRSLVDAAAEMVWTLSARGERVLDACGLRSFTGQTEAEMERGGWMSAVHPDDRRHTLRAWIKAIGRVEMLDTEHRIRRHDGLYRNMRVCAIPVTDSRGRVTEWVGMHLDITAQTARRESIASLQSFHALANILPQIVWTADANGEKTFANQHYFRYTGASSLEQIDRQWTQYIHPDDRPHVIRAWQGSLATGEPYECEYRFRRYDGTWRAFLARACPIHDANGAVIGWAGSSTDVQERKLADTAMRKAEKLSIAGRLAANIAHELNNPLASATNTLFLAMQDPGLSATTRSYLRLADLELQRIARLTRQTLRFHRQAMVPAMIDLCALMDSVLDSVVPHPPVGPTTERQYRPCGQLFGFTEDLRQAFTALVANALDALSAGGRLVIRIGPARRRDNQESGIRVTIADNGSGIPAHLIHDVCEPFVTTKDATGTGLGLWVTRGIVERQRGTLRIRSSTRPHRRGTAVALFFPYAGVVEGD